MISRIIGGDPMGATQFNHGRQAEELVEAGLMRDLTDIAEAEGWTRHRASGRRCSTAARSTAGSTACRSTSIPGSGSGFRTRHSRMPALRCRRTGTNSSPPPRRSSQAGKIPLAIGGQSWQTSGAFNVLMVALAGKDVLHAGLRRQGRRTWPQAPKWPACSRRPTTPAKCRPGLERSGLEPGDQPRHHRHRPAARSWATGRRANSRSPDRSPAKTTPACRGSASTN